MRGTQNGRPVPIDCPDYWYAQTPGHPVARMLAEAGRPDRSHTWRSGAPPRLDHPQRRAVPQAEVELRVGAAPQHEVWYTNWSRDRLDMWVQQTDDGQGEAGGWLYGRIEGRNVVIVDASAELEAARTRDSIRLDLDRGFDLEGPLRAEVIGCWHSHPRGIGLPSSTDCRAWSSWREQSRAPLFLGLIFAPDPSGFGHRSRAWITHAGAGQVVCSPAAIAREETVA